MTTNTNTANTDAARQQTLDTCRQQAHSGCFVCDPDNPHSLNLRCRPDGPGRVTATFQPQPWMTGFHNQLHGGIVSALLDGAMTQCLFAHDQQAVTALLHIRFRRPVPLDRELHITAWIEHNDLVRHQLRAELHDNATLLAEAEAVFTPNTEND